MPDQATNPSGPAPATLPQIDNPPAFPLHAPEVGEYGLTQEGMTLRDYYAGLAVTAFAARGRRGHAPAEMIAAACYELADAMLVERAKGAA